MKTTLDLPEEIVREMKLRAVMQGRTLRDLAADFLRQGLGMATPRPALSLPQKLPYDIGDNGIPVFRCGDNAPASHMTLKELLQLEQDALYEEDMQRAGIPL
jgi:plasmid stability protein